MDLNNNENGISGTVLVTGGTGFVGGHVILQLLQKGYHVQTTLRSLSRKGEVVDMIKTGGITDLSRLSFFETDLLKDDNWDEAMKGCGYVLHVASPIFLRLPENEDEMIKPAVEGVIRVLKAARNAGVKRVVMTSNFGAVGYSHKDRTIPITEENWTDPNEKGLSAYNKSKVMAELAAWDFMRREGGELELSVINPMAILGPSLSPKLSSGFELLLQVLNGTMKTIPDIHLGIVDVRDVADLHIRAMLHPDAKNQRFLALSGGTMSLLQISRFLKKEMPGISKRASLLPMPTWILRVASIFSKRARAILPLAGIYRNASNEKAKTLLGWMPRSNEEAILGTVSSLIELRLI